MSSENSPLWQEAQAMKAAMLEGERNLIQRILALWQAVQVRLESLYTRLYQQLEAVQADSTAPMSAARLRDLEITQQAIAETLLLTDVVGQQWAEMIEQRQREVIQQGESDANRMLEVAGIMAGLFLVLPAAWRTLLGDPSAILGTVTSGSSLSALIKQRIAEAVGSAVDAAITGITAGKPLQDVIGSILKELGQIANSGAIIGATETNRPYRYTLAEIFKLTQAPLVGYRRVATLDERTCLACIMADGRFYKIGQTFEEHVRGRCILVPVFPGQEASAPWKKGEDWFRDLPASTQQQMMGPARYDKWKNGDFDLQDLITVITHPEYGPSFQPTPAANL